MTSTPNRLRGRLRRRPRTYVAAGVVLLLVVVLAVFAVVRRGGDDSELEQAMQRSLPAAQRYSWTDWSAVRARLEQPLDASSSTQDLARMLTKGFDADLTSSSALLTSARAMQLHYGFSPASLDWELYAQADHEQVEMMKLGPSTSVDDVARALKQSGYAEPSSADGIWRAAPDTIKRLGEVTPELTYLILDAKTGIVLTSDSDLTLAAGLTALRSPRALDGGLAAAAGAVGVPLSAELYTSDQVCSALAMSGANSSDQAEAEQLLAQAGPVNPITGFAMADVPGGDTVVAMAFDSHDTAVTNARTRATLASGPAPGQGGTFGDRFRLGRVAADGDVVTMQLKPREGAYVLSDLDTGPLLFATC